MCLTKCIEKTVVWACGPIPVGGKWPSPPYPERKNKSRSLTYPVYHLFWYGWCNACMCLQIAASFVVALSSAATAHGTPPHTSTPHRVLSISHPAPIHIVLLPPIPCWVTDTLVYPLVLVLPILPTALPHRKDLSKSPTTNQSQLTLLLVNREGEEKLMWLYRCKHKKHSCSCHKRSEGANHVVQGLFGISN